MAQLPVVRTVALALGAFLMSGNVFQAGAGALRPTGLADGAGPVIRRRFWAEVAGATCSPEDITAEVLQHLPEFAPRLAAWFRGLDAPLPAQGGPPIVPGTRLRILMGLIRRARVVVEAVTPRAFRIRTLRLHADAGTVRFGVTEPGSGVLRLEIEVFIRAASWPDRLSYLLAAHALQRLNWETVLSRAVAVSGGRLRARGHETQEAAYVPPPAR